MRLKKINDHEAPHEVAHCYKRIREALGIPTTPVYFQYLGAFPPYLTYIIDSIVANLESPSFKSLAAQQGEFAHRIYRENFEPTQQIYSFVQQHIHDPELFHFKNDIQKILEVNARIMLIFIALRECVKGWAVSAKKLPYQTTTYEETGEVPVQEKEELLYGEVGLTQQKRPDSQNEHLVVDETVVSNKLIRRDTTGVVKALLPEYLLLCRNGFSQLLKDQAFLFFRVSTEKMALSAIDRLPEKLFSPINAVLELTHEYKHFSDLLYALSEHFPTYAVQRFLFSGYLKRGLS